MSARVHAMHHNHTKTNTHVINHLLTDPLNIQIANALSHEELTFPELAQLFPQREKQLSLDIDELVHAGVVTRHFGRQQISYRLASPRWSHFVQTLYGFWAELALS